MRGRKGILVASACLLLAGCKKQEAVGDGGAIVAGDASAGVVAKTADAAKAAPPPVTIDAAAAAAPPPAADAASVAADAAAAAADGTAAAAPAPDGASAAAPPPASPDAATAAAAAAAPPDAAAAVAATPPVTGGADGAWRDIGAAALTAIREGKPEPFAAMFPPFRAARAACDTLYPDTPKKRAEWTSRTDRQAEELDSALRVCRDFTDWSQGTVAPATWSAPSPVEKCEDLAESEMRILLDPGGEAGAAGTRYTVTVHVLVLAGQPYPTKLLCGVRKP